MVLSPGPQLLLVERGLCVQRRGRRVAIEDLGRDLGDLGTLGKPGFWRGIIVDPRTSHAFFSHLTSLIISPHPH